MYNHIIYMYICISPQFDPGTYDLCMKKILEDLAAEFSSVRNPSHLTRYAPSVRQTLAHFGGNPGEIRSGKM